MGSKSFPGIVHEYGGVNRLLIEGDPPLLDPGQVEKIVDHPQEPFGVLPGRQEQLDLLGGERTDNLLEQQMDDHLEAGERSLQLVAHGRDHVALELIDQVKLGHVGEDDRGSQQLARIAADPEDPREEIAVLITVTQERCVVECHGQVISLAAQDDSR